MITVECRNAEYHVLIITLIPCAQHTRITPALRLHESLGVNVWERFASQSPIFQIPEAFVLNTHDNTRRRRADIPSLSVLGRVKRRCKIKETVQSDNITQNIPSIPNRISVSISLLRDPSASHLGSRFLHSMSVSNSSNLQINTLQDCPKHLHI